MNLYSLCGIKQVALALAFSMAFATYTPRAIASPLRQSNSYIVHIVQQGDTVYLLARKYQVTTNAIVQANNLYNVNRIYPGQQLIIPLKGSQAYRAATPQYSSPPPSPVSSGQYYVVQYGDTLASIAYQHGTTAHRIAQVSGIRNYNFLYVGQRLFIPVSNTYVASASVSPYANLQQPTPFCPKDIYYTVRAGDTLAGIAYRFGTTVSAIVQANSIPNSRYIYVGQTLLIPR